MRRLGSLIVTALPLLALLSLGRAGGPDPLRISVALTRLSGAEAATLDLEASGAVQRPATPRERAVLQLRHRPLAATQVTRPAPTPSVPTPAPSADPVPPTPRLPLPVPSPVEASRRATPKIPVPSAPRIPPPVATPPAPTPPAPALAPVPHDLSKKLLEDARKVLQRAPAPPPGGPAPGWKGGPPLKKDAVRIHGQPGFPPGPKQGPKGEPKGAKQGPKPEPRQGPPPEPGGPHPQPKQGPRPR